MANASDLHVTSAIDQASLARRETRPQAEQLLTPSAVRRCLVVSGVSSYHTVTIPGADATTVETIVGVPSWDGYTYEPATRGVLIWEGENPVPFLLVAAGQGNETGEFTIAGTIRFFS